MSVLLGTSILKVKRYIYILKNFFEYGNGDIQLPATKQIMNKDTTGDFKSLNRKSNNRPSQASIH